MNRRSAMIGFGLTVLSGCAREPDAELNEAASATGLLPTMTVYKSEGCGCCDLWVDHVRTGGISVEVRELSNMGPTKERVGIPAAMGSCHTAEIGGYFVEGHVPVNDVLRLLREHPDVKGLTVPGMPVGSPGMEVPGQNATFQVLAVARDGSTSVYATYGGKEDMDMSGQATGQAASRTTGTIKEIDAAKGTVTLSHDPVPALKWPAMTMPFQISPSLAKGLKIGQRVTFEFQAEGMNGTITKISAIP